LVLVDQVELLKEIRGAIRQLLHQDLVQLQLLVVVVVAAAIVLMDPVAGTEVQEGQVAAVRDVIHLVVLELRGKDILEAVLVIRLVAVAVEPVARVGLRMDVMVVLEALE